MASTSPVSRTPTSIQLSTHDDIPHSHDEENPASPNSPTESLYPITSTRQKQVLLSAFLTIFLTIGLNQSYGTFQSYYISPAQTMLPSSSSSSALIAFIGTLSSGLTWSGGILINPLLTRLSLRGIRVLCLAGTVLMTVAFLLASLCTQIWQLLLTQGLCYGLGSSLLYFPILSSAPEYFTTHRGTALGIILSGSGIGGLVFSPLIRALLVAIGPRWTLRVLALICFLISLPVALTAAPSRFVGRRPTHIDLKLAAKPTFLFSVGAAFLQAGGNGLPLTFMAQYSVALGYSAAFGATLLAVSNGVNSVSRVVTGWLGDRFGRQNTLVLTVILCVVAVLGFWLESMKFGGNKVLWVLFVVVYGVAGGGYNALLPTTVAEIFGLHAYASVIGFIYFVRGLGVMFGSPVGGQILGENRLGNYKNMVVYDAVLFGGAAFCVAGVRFWDAIEKRSWKWRA